MHNQWANILFDYEKSSDMRIDLMSMVKTENDIYFTHESKFSFDEDKIKASFENGVLKVEVPKKQIESNRKYIDIE